jgi:hypothetical protein
MRYKQQTQTKLEAIDNQLLTIVKGLDTHTLSADGVIEVIRHVRAKIEGVISMIELEPNDYQ